MIPQEVYVSVVEFFYDPANLLSPFISHISHICIKGSILVHMESKIFMVKVVLLLLPDCLYSTCVFSSLFPGHVTGLCSFAQGCQVLLKIFYIIFIWYAPVDFCVINRGFMLALTSLEMSNMYSEYQTQFLEGLHSVQEILRDLAF